MKRKNWVTAIFVVIFLIGAPTGNAMAADEIRIGTIGPITGWATIFGQGALNGINLALGEYKNEFKGVPIKVFSEDTKADVEVMRTKLDSLKNRDKVHLIIGPSLGHEGMAAVDWGARNPEVPMLIGQSAPEDITMRKATERVIRPGWTGAQVILTLGSIAPKTSVTRRSSSSGRTTRIPGTRRPVSSGDFWKTAGKGRAYLAPGGGR